MSENKSLLLVQLLPTKKDHAQPKGEEKTLPKTNPIPPPSKKEWSVHHAMMSLSNGDVNFVNFELTINCLFSVSSFLRPGSGM